VENGYLMLNKKKIVVTGGTGRFGKVLKNYKTKKIYLFPSKKELNILKINSIKKYLKKKKPKYLIHLAGLSRPMSVHDTNIEKSINLNIIGTSNIVSVCSLLKIKVIYFSTNYVYPNEIDTNAPSWCTTKIYDVFYEWLFHPDFQSIPIRVGFILHAL